MISLLEKDLLLDDALAPVEATGFAAVERNESQQRWRWALGHEQTLRFPAEASGYGVYCTFRCAPGENLRLQVGANEFRFAAEREDQEEIRGYFDFSHAGPGSVEIRFSSTKAFPFVSNDQKPLSYSITEFRLVRSRIGGQLDPARVMSSPTFCALPFALLYLDNAGHPSACCEGEPFRSRAGGEGFARHWNHPELRAVRAQMAAGQWPKGCGTCQRAEREGHPSPRIALSKLYHREAAAALPHLQQDGSLASPPRAWDVIIGNTCNLKCRMCSPMRSSGLLEEFKRVYEWDFTEATALGKWLAAGPARERLLDDMAGADSVKLVGGEPFVMPQFRQMLQGLINRGRAEKMKLVFHTNATVIREDIFPLLEKFRETECIVSLEGVGAVNDFLRYPSQFSVIQKNIDFLYENRARWNMTLEFSAVAQIYNIFHLPELFSFLQARYPLVRWFPQLKYLYEPRLFAVSVLPEAGREEARISLRAYLQKMERNWEASPQSFGPVTMEEIRSSLQPFLAALDAPHEPGQLPKFLELHERFQASRGRGGSIAVPGVL